MIFQTRQVVCKLFFFPFSTHCLLTRFLADQDESSWLTDSEMSTTDSDDRPTVTHDHSLLPIDSSHPIGISTIKTKTSNSDSNLAPNPNLRVYSPFNYSSLSSSSLNILYQEDVDRITREQETQQDDQLKTSEGSGLEERPSLVKKLTGKLSKSKRSPPQLKGSSIKPTDKLADVISNFVPSNSLLFKSNKDLSIPNNAAEISDFDPKSRDLDKPHLSNPSSHETNQYFTNAIEDGQHNGRSRFNQCQPEYNWERQYRSSQRQFPNNIVVFDGLKSLAWENDPLIDSTSVTKVLRSGKVTVLQRTFRKNDLVTSGDRTPKLRLSTNLKDFTSVSTANEKKSEEHKSYYFDSEQVLSSPWSSSPAPSPALHEFQETPFFANFNRSAQNESVNSSTTGTHLIPHKDKWNSVASSDHMMLKLPKNLNHTQGQTIQPLTATPLPNLHSMSSHQNHSYGLTSISEMEAAFDTEEQESDGYLATSNDDYSESFGNKIGDKNYSELFLNLQSNQSPGDSFPTSPKSLSTVSSSVNLGHPAIGVENTVSVIHIPLVVPSKISITNALNVQSHKAISYNNPAPPIGILSILSSLMPYPQDKLDILKKMVPHIATALINAKSHTNLNNQLENMLASASGLSSGSMAPMGSSASDSPGEMSYSFSEAITPTPLASPPELPDLPKLGHDVVTPTDEMHQRHDSSASTIYATTSNSSIASATESTIISGSAQSFVNTSEVPLVETTSNTHVTEPIQSWPRNDKREAFAPAESSNSVLQAVKQTTAPQRGYEKFTNKFVGNFALRHSKRLSNGSLIRNSNSTPNHVDNNPPGKAEGDHPKHHYVHSRKNSRPHFSVNPVSRGTLSVKMLRKIVESIPVQIYTIEPGTGHVSWASNRTTGYLGRSFEEFCADPYASIHPSDKEKFINGLHEALRSGEAFSRMTYIRRFDNQYRTTMFRCYPLRDERGVTTFWLCTLFDVHQQRKAEVREIKRVRDMASDHKYQILAESTPIIVFTFHPSKGIIYANQAWFHYSGASVQDTYGFQYVNYIYPEDRDKCLIDIEKFRKKKEPQSNSTSDPESDSNNPFTGRLPTGNEDCYTVEARLCDQYGNYQWHLVTYTSVDSNGQTRRSSVGSIASSTSSEENVTSETSLETGLWFGTCTNINDQKLNQAKLQKAKDEAQRTIESKTIFLSNMSHEIRTPLIGISGMVSFLLDTPLTEEQLDYCHTISSSSDALLNVINDILDLSKVESGKMTLTVSWYHVRRLVEEANEFLSSMAISKSLELNYLIENDVPTWVKGDKIRLRQVMLNIIGNAIKFTDTGEVFTRCSVVKEVFTEEESNDPEMKDTILLKFEVIDTGRGFTTEDEHKMFKPFSQLKQVPKDDDQFDEDVDDEIEDADDSDEGSFTGSERSDTASSNNSSERRSPVVSPGTGLGLVISRQLIQLHGGNLTCQSEKNKGSTFEFTCRVKLPTKDDKPSNVDDTKESQKKKQHKKSTDTPLDILIICPYKYAPQSIVHHIIGTVSDPWSVKCNVVETDEILLGYVDGSSTTVPTWTHVIINSHKEDLARTAHLALAVNKMFNLSMYIVLLTPLMQQSTILESLSSGDREYPRLKLLHKPLTLSKYSQVFDPRRQRESSKDLKMKNAQEVLENQKDVFKIISQFVRKRAQAKFLSGIGADSLSASNLSINSGVSDTESVTSSIAIDSPNLPHDDGPESKNLQYVPLSTLTPPQLVVSSSGDSNNLFVQASGVRSNMLSSLHTDDSDVESVNEVTVRKRSVSSSSNSSLLVSQPVVGAQASSSSQGDSSNLDYASAVRILIAEDNPVNQKVLGRFFKKAGLSCDIVSDGVECTSAVFKNRLGYYDLIICDLDMPRKNGFEACKEIREWERKQRNKRSKRRERLQREKEENNEVSSISSVVTPGIQKEEDSNINVNDEMPPIAIVALSAYVMSDMVDQCYSAGFTRYISKPIDFVKLKDLILELLDN